MTDFGAYRVAGTPSGTTEVPVELKVIYLDGEIERHYIEPGQTMKVAGPLLMIDGREDVPARSIPLCNVRRFEETRELERTHDHPQ